MFYVFFVINLGLTKLCVAHLFYCFPSLCILYFICNKIKDVSGESSLRYNSK